MLFKKGIEAQAGRQAFAIGTTKVHPGGEQFSVTKIFCSSEVTLARSVMERSAMLLWVNRTSDFNVSFVWSSPKCLRFGADLRSESRASAVYQRDSDYCKLHMRDPVTFGDCCVAANCS